MAPAQILDLPQTQANYTHKKFHGNRYAHKKFGTRPPPTQSQHQSDYGVIESTENQEKETIITHTFNSKRSSGDIFRPYALEENTSRKRKHHEVQEEDKQVCSYSMNNKRFATSTMVSQMFPPASSPQTGGFPPVSTPYNPLHCRLQQLHFNPQMFAMILQKQQAALRMGEILKRQPNFNLHNIMGI